ncbi:hypothetical protein TTHERM_00298330 (macronuclear) [Tetrahymena thermophila SB210]|uniref:CHAT domain protein n=1 Tax=Tetrahymena thermophila (strain SB210) TaxID=312017 RepID=I7M3S7_TETTS|nr:hypothetical protein TTHERM_00298330 [Tetrahymena thermophila SB210]EAS04222.2 hypothetical protein TTHERM_00298330 [Tetrahymena thermophila SB210]|eukprot:XP_001024467.2 hypothetical protein TTHERM_00298330 [Tetrahymena thermophila SB210]
MSFDLSQHKIEFLYQQSYNKKRTELITITVGIKVENLLSNSLYCLKYSEITESLEKEDIICNNGQPISYTKDGEQGQLSENEFIEIDLDVSSTITNSKIIFKDAGLGLQNKLKQQDMIIQSLQKQINEIKENMTKIQNNQNNQIKSQIDILFLIGMPKKENSNDVSCEKEIMKIQSVLYKKKIGCSISIVKTKESFKEMLSLNPQIIHVICHGKRLLDSNKYTTYLEIEDQKGEQQMITGQQFMKWIQKSNCNPSLIILNACYSQGIYDDMLRIKNNKVFNTLAINSEFEINDKYAYKFVTLVYKKFLSQIRSQISESQDKKVPQNQKENKILWLKIIEEAKQHINSIQLKQMIYLNQVCCTGNACEFQQFKEKNKNCDCFKNENQKNFEYCQTKHPNLVKGLTENEFNYLKQFIELHQESCKKTNSEKLFFLSRKYYMLFCNRCISKLFKDISSLRKSHIYKRFLTSLENQSQIQEAIFLISVNFLKQMFLEGERFKFNQQKNSTYPNFSLQDHKYQQLVLNGPDFLSNYYPKLSRSKDIDDIDKSLSKCMKKSQKDFSLKLNYYEQSKGRFLKYLTDVQSKSTDYKSQIHILNITGIDKMEDFQRIFLLDLKQIKKNILEQDQNQDHRINLFYFYDWKKLKDNDNLSFVRGRKENIQLYIQHEEENIFDSIFFYSFTIKNIDNLIKNLPLDQIQIIMEKLKLDLESVKEYLKYCQIQKQNKLYEYYEKTYELFNDLIKQKSIRQETNNCMFQQFLQQINETISQNNSESLDQIESSKKSEKHAKNYEDQQSYEKMNRYLLSFIDPENYRENKYLYKYLFKNIMINCSKCHQLIQKKGLMKCLLKIILQNCQINKDKLQILYQNPINSKNMNIWSLKGILNFFSIEYFEIAPQFREIAKYIILNELQPLDFVLTKSYLIGINFEKKFHKEFRDIIKIHKRVLTFVKKCQTNNEIDSFSDLKEVECILDYLKVKYYNQVARLNHKNYNLHYLSIKNANINLKENSQLSIMVQQRNIIRTISYIDFQKSTYNDIDYILNLNKKFQNNYNQVYKVQLRKQTRQSPINQSKNVKKQCIYILLQSNLLKELIYFLNKAQLIKNNRIQIENSVSDLSEGLQGISKIKHQVLELRKIYIEFKSEYSQNFKTYSHYQQHIQQSFTAYYELELLIEQIFHNIKNTNTQSLISLFGNIQLNCEDFYEIFSKVNEDQILNSKINQNLLQNFHDSFLFVQYYFKCARELLHSYIDKSFYIKKNIYENIYNRVIFTTKLFTKSNVQQIQKIQEFKKLKKIIIIDQDDSDLKDKYEILDLENLNTQKNQPNLKDIQQVELLIILNYSESYDLEQSIFKEKWVLCFNSPLNQHVKEKQTTFLMHLLKNIIKNEQVNFPLALQKSFNSNDIDLQNHVRFRCFQKQNIDISNLCYSNSESKLNQQTLIQEIIQQEVINNYLDYQKSDPQIDLQGIFGKKQTNNLTITDSNFSNNFQESFPSIENQNSDSFSISFPNTTFREMNSQQNDYNQQGQKENDEDDGDQEFYSSQIQTQRNMLSFTRDKTNNRNNY